MSCTFFLFLLTQYCSSRVLRDSLCFHPLQEVVSNNKSSIAIDTANHATHIYQTVVNEIVLLLVTKETTFTDVGFLFSYFCFCGKKKVVEVWICLKELRLDIITMTKLITLKM